MQVDFVDYILGDMYNDLICFESTRFTTEDRRGSFAAG